MYGLRVLVPVFALILLIAGPGFAGEAAPEKPAEQPKPAANPDQAEPAEGGEEAEPAEGGEETMPEPTPPPMEEPVLPDEVHKAILGQDGYAEVFFVDGARLRVHGSEKGTRFSYSRPSKDGATPVLNLENESLDVKLGKNPLYVTIPAGEIAIQGTDASVVISVGETSTTISRLPKDPGKVLVFLKGQRAEVSPGSSLEIGPAGLTGGETGEPSLAGQAETALETFHYVTGVSGSINLTLPGSITQIDGADESDIMISANRAGQGPNYLGKLNGGVFHVNALQSSGSVLLETPNNRLSFGKSAIWAKVAGPLETFRHSEGDALSLSSKTLAGFKVELPAGGGANLLHPEGDPRVLVDAYESEEGAQPIKIIIGDQTYILPPKAKATVTPEPEEKHPEESGEVLFKAGALEVMLFGAGEPMSLRFGIGTRKLIRPELDPFELNRDTGTPEEASPYTP